MVIYSPMYLDAPIRPVQDSDVAEATPGEVSADIPRHRRMYHRFLNFMLALAAVGAIGGAATLLLMY